MANRVPTPGHGASEDVAADSRPPLRVLMVEDSEDDCVLILRELERGGFQTCANRVETAEDMAAALNREQWDLVLADYSIPDFSAQEAQDVLRASNIDIPFIVVSGAMGEETAVSAMKAGAHDYIMKNALKRVVPAVIRELRDAEVRREHRRGQEALRESEERYRTLVIASPLPILIVCEERVVFANPAAVEALGAIKESELLGKPMELFVHENSRAATLTRVRATYDGIPQLGLFDEQFVRLDGEPRHVEVMATPIDYKGQPASQVVFTDVTARKVAEEERERLEGQLRQAQKMEAVGHLAGGVAHDFNNLLSPILGYAEILLMGLHDEDPRHSKLQEIVKAAMRARTLTRQLLAFSRKQVLDFKTVNLNEILDDFADNILSRTIREDIKIRKKTAPELSHTRADVSQIEQILMNLAVNAQDAMPSGGTMSFETSDAVLDEAHAESRSGAEPGRYVVLAVSDTGCGMSKETQAHVFEPFYTTKEKGKGTGLGLATVHGIVRQHGGHIWVYSAPGQGTTFKIYFPTVWDEPDPASSPALQQPDNQGNETVLVVEDEDMVLNLACSILQEHGYNTLRASSAEEGLRIAKEHEGDIQLLLSDVVMPDVNGKQLRDRVAKLYPEIRALFMSGYTDDVIAHHGVLEKGIDFLEKPFTVQSLARTVRETLDK